MEKFQIDQDAGKIRTINRTIRITMESFDKLNELSEKTGVSFNKIVNQCIDYALKNMNEPE